MEILERVTGFVPDERGQIGLQVDVRGLHGGDVGRFGLSQGLTIGRTRILTCRAVHATGQGHGVVEGVLGQLPRAAITLPRVRNTRFETELRRLPVRVVRAHCRDQRLGRRAIWIRRVHVTDRGPIPNRQQRLQQ